MMRELLAPQAKSLNRATLEVCRPVKDYRTWAPPARSTEVTFGCCTVERSKTVTPTWSRSAQEPPARSTEVTLDWVEKDQTNVPVPPGPPTAWTLWVMSPHQVAAGMPIIWPPDPTDPTYASKAACERAGAAMLSTASKAGRARSFECLPSGIAPRDWYRR